MEIIYDVQQQNQQCIAAFPQQHQQQALEIVDKIQVALEESNNTYIQTFKSIHQIESEIKQTTGLHAEKNQVMSIDTGTTFLNAVRCQY